MLHTKAGNKNTYQFRNLSSVRHMYTHEEWCWRSEEIQKCARKYRNVDIAEM